MVTMPGVECTDTQTLRRGGVLLSNLCGFRTNRHPPPCLVPNAMMHRP